jgi:hypothetical protein
VVGLIGEYGPIFDPLRPDLTENLRLQRRDSNWTSHVISLHEVSNEEADSINRFRRLHRYAFIHRCCAGEAKMQRHEAVTPARILVVASD